MEDLGKLTDQQLTIHLKSGDSAAFTEIFQRYKAILYTHAFRMLEDQQESEDVVQEVFLTLWQNHQTLEISGALSSYLYIAVRNRIYKVFAHQKVARRYLDSLDAFLESGQSFSDDKLIEKELTAIIDQEISALPEKMRQAYLLSRDGEHTYREIGEKLGISEKTVRNQVYNAIKILKTKISPFLSILLFF